MAVSVINLAQFDRLLIAIIPLNLLCHISLRFNGMSYDDPLTHCTGKQRCYFVNFRLPYFSSVQWNAL